MKLRLAPAIFLAALLITGGPARAAREQEQEQEAAAAAALTPDERREAGEFLLRLDERWREARDFSALFDEAFVGDFVESSGDRGFLLSLLEEPLREQLSAAERRRAHVVGLDFIYVAGRLNLAFDLREKKTREEKRAAAAAARQPAGGGETSRGGEEDEEPSLEKKLSPAVVEVFRSNPLTAPLVAKDGEGGDEESPKIETHEQFDSLVSTFESALPEMRARVKELEDGLPGAPLSAVAREDEGEGEWPELRLMASDAEWRNRPAGTRLVCGYISNLHVHLVREGGRYRVLTADVDD